MLRHLVGVTTVRVFYDWFSPLKRKMSLTSVPLRRSLYGRMTGKWARRVVCTPCCTNVHSGKISSFNLGSDYVFLIFSPSTSNFFFEKYQFLNNKIYSHEKKTVGTNGNLAKLVDQFYHLRIGFCKNAFLCQLYLICPDVILWKCIFM